MGLDTSRDITSLDTGEQQHLARLVNATCDWRGQIVRDPGFKRVAGAQVVVHNAFYGENRHVFAEQDGHSTNLVSDAGHRFDEAFPRGAAITSTVFGRNVHFASRGALMMNYDGAAFRETAAPSLSILRPSIVTTVQRRMAIAGMPGFETEVHFSRVDRPDVFPDDEAPDEESVLRAGIIDVGNIIGTAGRITGLGAYEQNKLAIFTEDRAVIYAIDPDLEEWQLDDSANIRVGCVSHNTIVPAGQDLIFCSRDGIHSIRRSDQNGILLASYSLSDKVDLLYQALVASVEDPSLISAVYDQDRGHYHVFFPQPGGRITERLTLALNGEIEGGMPKFSTGDFLNARCGAFLAGTLAIGTPGGVYTALRLGQEGGADAVIPEATIQTPLLWHGSLSDTKQTHSLVLQASGEGIIEMVAHDLEGRTIGSLRIEITATSDDDRYTGVPLSRQYERQWQHRYLAATYTFRIVESRGLVRLIGFAIKTRSD